MLPAVTSFVKTADAVFTEKDVPAAAPSTQITRLSPRVSRYFPWKGLRSILSNAAGKARRTTCFQTGSKEKTCLLPRLTLRILILCPSGRGTVTGPLRMNNDAPAPVKARAAIATANRESFIAVLDADWCGTIQGPGSRLRDGRGRRDENRVMRVQEFEHSPDGFYLFGGADAFL